MGFPLEKSSRILRSAAIPVLTALVVFGLAACGDDGPTGPDVSQEQAEKVARAVTNGAGEAFNVVFNSASGSASGSMTTLGSIEVPAAAKATGFTAGGPRSFTVDATRSCPEGGTVSTSGDGTATTTETTLEMSWNVQLSYNDCGETDNVLEESGGTVFVLSTSSPLQYSGDGMLTAEDQNGDLSGSFTWNYSGSVDWDEQGGSSGNCDVDLTTTLDIQSFSPSNATVETRGTVCGRDINQTFQVTGS